MCSVFNAQVHDCKIYQNTKQSMIQAYHTISMELQDTIQMNCPICLKSFQGGVSPFMICRNQHVICDSCSLENEWALKMNDSCPFCKEDLFKQRVPFRLNSQVCKLIRQFRSMAQKEQITKIQRKQSDLYDFKQYLNSLQLLSEIAENANQKPYEGIYQTQPLWKYLKCQIDKAQNELVFHPIVTKEKILQVQIMNTDVETAIELLKKQIEGEGLEKQMNFSCLGNEEEIIYSIDSLDVVSAFSTLSHKKQVSVYDMLSFWCMYSERKYQHTKWYRKMVKAQPQNPYLLFGLANLVYNTHQYSQASQIYLRCYQLLPDSEDVLQWLGISYFRTDPLRMKNIFSRLYKIGKLAVCLLVTKGYCNLDQVDRVRKIAKQDPSYARAWISLSMLDKTGKKQVPAAQLESFECTRLILEGLRFGPPTIGLHLELLYLLKPNTEMELKLHKKIIQNTTPFFEIQRHSSLEYVCEYTLQNAPDQFPKYDEQFERFATESLYRIGLKRHKQQCYVAAKQLWDLNWQRVWYIDQFPYYYALNLMDMGSYQIAQSILEQQVQKHRLYCYEPLIKCYMRLDRYEEALKMAKKWDELAQSSESSRAVKAVLQLNPNK